MSNTPAQDPPASSNLSCRTYEHGDRVELADFFCGNEEYAKEIAEWIQEKNEGCVSDDLRSGRAEQVWVYRLGEDSGRQRIIAYGALATEVWVLDPRERGSLEVSMIAYESFGFTKLLHVKRHHPVFLKD